MKKKIFSLVFALILICNYLTLNSSFAVSPKEVISSKETEKAINEFLDVVTGLSVSSVCGDESYCKGGGFDSIKDSVELTENPHVEIVSVSKEFTALSVLLMQEEEKLSVDDSVSDYLPWFKVTYNGEKADVKIWYLLNHCSGLPNVDCLFPVGSDDTLKEKTVLLVEGFELDFQPVERFSYNNVGFDLLAFITETVSGRSFEDYVTEEIFKPIGMNNSSFDITVQDTGISTARSNPMMLRGSRAMEELAMSF